MVTFANTDKTLYLVNSNLINTRIHKRISLQVTLFLRALTNHISYGRKVQTINISEKGLLVSSDIALKVGMEIELTTATRRVIALAEVKHVTYDTANKKWLIGLAIREKKTAWFISESCPLLETPSAKNFSLSIGTQTHASN